MKSGDDTDAAGLAKIARGLSELFNFLADLDRSGTQRRGRHEKDGMVFEYSFGKRTAEAATRQRGEAEAAAEPQARPPRARRNAARRTARRSIELLEPVTDVFDEPDEVVVLFELPGVSLRDIRCLVDGDILLLEAKTGGRLYRKEILIDAKLAEGAPRLRLRNGILEARLAKLTEGKAGGAASRSDG